MPDWTEELERRLRGAGLRGASEAEVIEELSQHLEDRYQELRSRNVSDADARRVALGELEEDDVLGRRVSDANRERPEPDVVGGPGGRGMVDGLVGDVRVAVRVLSRAPLFTGIVAVLIALGIGANTTIFSIINAVLLRPLPGVHAPAELASVYTSDYSGPRFGASSYPDYEAIRASGAFAGVIAHRPIQLRVTIDELAVKVLGEAVSSNYFDVLGVVPARGRFFITDGDAEADATAAVISHEMWQRRFGGEGDIIGRSIRVNGTALTVVGVAPASFRGMLRGIHVEVWTSLEAAPGLANFELTHRGDRGLFVVGRLREGTRIEGVQAQLAGVAAQLHAAFPGEWTDVNQQSRVLTVLPEPDARVPPQVRAPALGVFAALMAVVIVVLLIACSNVANLMLTRASARTTEMGIRLALGATPGRIMRQLLTESVLLASLGGVLGVLLALWLTRAVNTIRLPIEVPASFDIALDGRVLAFAALVTVTTGLLFGVLPALQASRALAPMMKGATSARPRTRLRSALVVVQVAASLVLLACGGLVLRSLMAAQRIDTGIRTENMLLVSFDMTSEGLTEEGAQQFYEQLQERARALPGVVSTTLAERVPLFGWGRRSIYVEGYEAQPDEDMEFGNNRIGPGYFEVMGIELVRGRGFTESDRTGAPEVVVVNETFARHFWPGEDAIGKRVGLSGAGAPLAEVVGVARDGKYRSLTEEPTPYFYFPYLQRPSAAMMLHVRTASDPAPLVAGLRGLIREVAPLIAVPTITTLRSYIGLATLPQRVAAVVLGVLGALALLIAGIGLYGVVAFVVAQRMREFGIRSALGATASDVQRLVLAQGVRLAFIGVVIGTVIALVIAQVARGLLLVEPLDPVALLSVIAVLSATATIASWIPARRAMRADPLTVLRSE